MLRIVLAVILGIQLAPPSWSASFTREQSGRVARVVGQMLERLHYRHAPFDDEMSGRFLKNYFDTLDYTHMIFIQTDLEEFQQRYADRLDDLTLRSDVSPAFEIFARFLERLAERNDFVQKVIHETMDFTSEETYLRQRNKAPWPNDVAEAEQLWRARVKLELLQDRLAKARTKLQAAKVSEAGVKDAVSEPSSLSPALANAEPTGAVEAKSPPTSDLALDPVKIIGRRYERMLKTMREYDNEQILQVYLSALARAYDPHTDYLSPTEAADFDINHIKLKLTGIGARLRWEDGFTKVESLVPGGPAALSRQIKPNDRIIAVSQAEGEPVDVVELPLRKVVEMIRGPVGTEVLLTILPADDPDGASRKVIRLVRDEIKISEQYAKAKVIEQPDPIGGVPRRLGVIALPQFYDNCARDVAKLIQRLQKEQVSGLVLDLRHNGGGLLDQAIELTGLFIPEGPVVQVRDNRKSTQIYVDDDESVAFGGPLIVMVDHLSASASEITAAALQDHGRALVVGDSATHGKGTVQSVLALDRAIPRSVVSDPGKLKLTISKFYRIAGGTTQQHGVTPDIVLPSIYEYMEIGEAHLPNCLPADETAPANYARMDKVRPYLSLLRSNSVTRLSQSQDFAYLREDIERLKQQREDKTISLNEAKHLQDLEEENLRRQQRKTERSQRQSFSEKIYEITLEMAEKDAPLQAAAGALLKEEEALAAASESAEAAAEDEEASREGAIDFRLREGLLILGDYIQALGKAGDGLVATAPLKTDTSATPR
jgi:carboxyl-terminal processing protease